MHRRIPALSAVIVVLAILITACSGGNAASSAGAAGVILAIPVAGCLSVSLRHWREYRDIERLVRAAARK